MILRSDRGDEGLTRTLSIACNAELPLGTGRKSLEHMRRKEGDRCAVRRTAALLERLVISAGKLYQNDRLMRCMNKRPTCGRSDPTSCLFRTTKRRKISCRCQTRPLEHPRQAPRLLHIVHNFCSKWEKRTQVFTMPAG